MTQVNVHQILIFGGEHKITRKDTEKTYFLNIEDHSIKEGPPLPEKVLPESPGYTLNSFACFYFLGSISTIFKFNKEFTTWSKLEFQSQL
jgi:hypothetical protein